MAPGRHPAGHACAAAKRAAKPARAGRAAQTVCLNRVLLLEQRALWCAGALHRGPLLTGRAARGTRGGGAASSELARSLAARARGVAPHARAPGALRWHPSGGAHPSSPLSPLVVVRCMRLLPPPARAVSTLSMGPPAFPAVEGDIIIPTRAGGESLSTSSLRKSTKLPYQPGKKFSTSLPLLPLLFTHNPVSSAGRATSALCARLTCGSYSTIRALHHLQGMRCGATLRAGHTHTHSMQDTARSRVKSGGAHSALNTSHSIPLSGVIFEYEIFLHVPNPSRSGLASFTTTTTTS